MPDDDDQTVGEHDQADPDAKAHADAFQPDFLRDVGEAVAAGFPPNDADPEYGTDPAAIDAAWTEAGQ